MSSIATNIGERPRLRSPMLALEFRIYRQGLSKAAARPYKGLWQKNNKETAMWNKVAELLGLGDKTKGSKANELQLATAALLVHVASVDGDFDDDERERLTDCLTEHFWLTAEEAEQIIEDAEEEEHDASCLYRFTRAITSELDQEGRQEIVRLLWQVAFADNRIDNFEANVLAKIAGLLGVTEQDRIRIKHEVEAETA
jgi:uncharacterized tellurite resistance protein B-like protein